MASSRLAPADPCPSYVGVPVGGFLVNTQSPVFSGSVLVADEHFGMGLFWQFPTEAYFFDKPSIQSHTAELSLALHLRSLSQPSGEFVANFLVTTMCLNTVLPD